MNNKGLNAKIKIFIIVIYTIVLFSIILLSFGKSKINRFSEYQDKAYDDQIAVNLRDIENRKSKLSTGSEDEEGKHEKSTHDLQIQIVKLKSNTSIKNIKIYLAAKTLDNGYRYDEYTSSSKEMSTLVYTSITSFTTFATKEIEELTKDGKKEEYLFDETPIEYYIRISYTLNDENEERILAYKTKALSFNQEKTFKDVENRKVDSNNANYIESKDDPIKLKVNKTLISEESSLKEIKNDTFRLAFNEINDRTDDIISWEAAYKVFTEIQKESYDSFLKTYMGNIDHLKDKMEEFDLNEKDEERIRVFIIVISLIAQASVIKKIVQRITNEYDENKN